MRRLSLIVLSVLALQFWDIASADTVGRTPGQFGVSSTGAATYTIPIWAPPGPQGVQPHIALVYNSQSGMGPEGMGWSVSGLSSISRCNRTVAQDGAPASVALTNSDAFCLDGQRLRLTSSDDLTTYGKDGTTYQTEVAEFSNVTAHDQTTNGPTYFTVQGRNGWTYEYGNTTDSRVIPTGSGNPSGAASSWMLDKVTDRYQNTMTIVWETAGANLSGMTVPANISWNQGQYIMAFYYETISEPTVSGYLAGTVVQNYYLLHQVYLAAAGGVPKNYVLSYGASATPGQSTLMSVAECADFFGSNCLYPTKMDYQAGQAGIATASPLTVSTPSYHTGDTLYSAFDLNGDGINDLAFYESGMWYVAFGSTSGYAAAVATGITDPSAILGYIDSSGSAAFVANSSSQWWYYKWNASAQTFAGTSFAAAVPHEYSATLADINGDGLADLIYINADTSHVNVLYNGSTGTGVTFGALMDAGAAPVFEIRGAVGSQAKLDFTGDGQGDLLGVWGYSNNGVGYVSYYALHFTGPTTYTTTLLIGNIPSATGLAFDVGDYNDDGCADLLVENQLVFSGCNGSPSTTLPFDYPAVGGINWDGSSRRAVLANNQGHLVVYNSLGNTLDSPIDTTIPFNSSNVYVALPNPTGDGFDALGVFNQASMQYYLHNGAGQPPDLLTTVTDGYGNSAKPTYVSIAQSSYTGSADAVYPYANYAGPMYVVNNVTFSDPSNAATGAKYSTAYSYAGAWMQVQGRGFSGFNSVQSTDSRSVSPATPAGLTETTSYERAFPYTGMMLEDTVANGASPVSDTTQTPTCTPLPSCAPSALHTYNWNQRYFAYFPTVVTKQWELNDDLGADPTTTKTITYDSPDSYGNFNTITQIVKETDPGALDAYKGKVWTTKVSNTLDADPANWCLSLFTQQTVAYSSTDGGAPVTRTTGFIPDTVRCNYTQKVTEPAGSVYSPAYTVTEALEYDDFGNLDKDTVTGNSMASRQTQMQWNATGQFPLYVTNALNQKTTFAYDPFWGTRTSVLYPNGTTQQWTYDPAFGRLTGVQNTDHTSTQVAYSDCAPTCLFGAHGMVVSTTAYNTDQTVMTDGTDYYDPTDRQLVSTQRSLANGTYTRKDTRYDSMGNVSSQSAPCTWVSIGSTCPPGTLFAYDALNRRISAQLQSSDLPTTKWSYSGTTVVQQDPGKNNRTLINDSAGRLRQTIDANGYTVILSYDAAGTLTERADNLGRTLWTSGTSLSGPGAIQYGVAPFTVTATDLARGTRSTTFDALGERRQLIDANGNTTVWNYDALARPTTRAETDLADASLNFFTQWDWDNAANGVGQLQDVCTLTGGNPQSCATNSGGYSESYGYDTYGRLQQQSIVIPGQSAFNYFLAYNSSGLLGTLTYPVTVGTPLQIQYYYNNGLLQSVKDVNDSVTVWTDTSLTPAGQVHQETLGNSVVITRDFDSTSLRLNAITAGVGANPLLEDQSYEYFPTGNVKQRQDTANGSLTENFSYDSLNRLSSSQLTTQAGTSTNLQMCYDNTGSGCSLIAKGPGLITSKTADTIQPVSYSTTWSPYNYPVSIQGAAERVDFAYGPDRQRWQQNYNQSTEITNYIGGLLEQVITGTGTTYRHYIYAGAEPVAIMTPGSTNKLEYMLSDHEGSISALVKSDGTHDVNESFTAYGARRDPSTWVGAPSGDDLTKIAGITRQGYTFQTAIGQSLGLNHMNGRVQDTITGQFLSPDPNIPDTTNTQDYNPYGYVRNNPLSLIDPSGFILICSGYNPNSLPLMEDPDLPYYDRDTGALIPDSVTFNGKRDPQTCVDLPNSPSPAPNFGALPNFNFGSSSSSGTSGTSGNSGSGSNWLHTFTLCDEATSYYESVKKESPSILDATGNLLGAAEFTANQTVNFDAQNLSPSAIKTLTSAARIAKVGGGLIAVGQVGYGIVNGVRTGQTGDLEWQSIDILADVVITAAGGGVLGAGGAIAFNLNGGSKQLLHTNPQQAAAQAMIMACQDEIH